MTKQISHIAIIMDGNGRWAKERDLKRSEGHKEGGKTAMKIIGECLKRKIKYLTLYAFSSENWKRPAEEVGSLMELLVFYLDNKIAELNKNNIKINFIGRVEELSLLIRSKMRAAEKLTAKNDGLFLSIALNYGGRQEIVDACNKLIANGARQIDEGDINTQLYTPTVPMPDLLIRTSGEKRISNFLLWQIAYSELYFSDAYWPDFSTEELALAIQDYHLRERRFGDVL